MKLFIRNNKKQITPSLEEIQVEKLKELGNKLATIRKQKGLSLEDLVLLTRIPRRILLAIEEGNLSDLPEPVYLQGLISQFADALGLKGREFASSFPVGSMAISLPKSLQKTSMPQLRPLHLYLLYIVVIICSVNGLSQLLNNATFPNNNTQILTENLTEKSQKLARKNDQEIPPNPHY
ncbi:helix-turn-helix domain-containing protein [Anabaena sp. FACHB-1237]|uniref:helix-turn-helix domain-containing protein n=1 Tax=Anabaena sp. FACHB-1237 TaxID=2692769 RepID=UPI00168012F0|nr:helix-turn-helix domain-containing protein [Anabaena sp. FACHB-1237]MBD2137418.1 helix-turn-helix domain-containing protein [Anabaena sp. FACHB-1237]